MNDYLSEVFGDGGLFARGSPATRCARARWRSPAWSTRPCAAGVTPSAKGPCGTGKSVAYAVPAVHHAHHEKKRVVIATMRTSRCRSSSSGRTCRCSRACCRGRSRSRC